MIYKLNPASTADDAGSIFCISINRNTDALFETAPIIGLTVRILLIRCKFVAFHCLNVITFNGDALLEAQTELVG
jgi:hypothetical protein